MSQACSPNQRRMASASRSGKKCTCASTIIPNVYPNQHGPGSACGRGEGRFAEGMRSLRRYTRAAMRRDSIVLALAFVAVAAAFVGSTVVAQRAAREVGVLAASIARDAAPGLAAMSNVRGEVRRLQELVTRVAVLGPAAGDRAEIDETRRGLDEHLAEFRS